MNDSAKIQRVLSLELPELAPYRTLRRTVAHRQQGIFVAEGEKVVRRLLESPLEVISLLLTPDWCGRLAATGHLKGREGATAFLAEGELLRGIVGFNIHQGIMAVGKVPADGSLDALAPAQLLVALDGLRISENVGVIVRNGAAFGVQAILVGETACSPYLRRAVRNSMGAVFQMPIIHVPCLADVLERLKLRYGSEIVVADPHGATTIYDTSLAGSVCIVLGNEDYGVSPEIAGLATARAAIPMHNRTDSLNVASASAVFLYEAARQRVRGGGGV